MVNFKRDPYQGPRGRFLSDFIFDERDAEVASYLRSIGIDPTKEAIEAQRRLDEGIDFFVPPYDGQEKKPPGRRLEGFDPLGRPF